MKGKVTCTCGWSWNKSDSSKKDMYICHECGRDNSNNMKNGGDIPQAQGGENLITDERKEAVTKVDKTKVKMPNASRIIKDIIENKKEEERQIKDEEEWRSTGVIKNPRSIKYKKAKEELEKRQTYLTQTPYVTEGMERYNEAKRKAAERKEKIIKPIIKVADVTTDLMQLGNFVPHPIGQTIGKIGNVAGAAVDAFQAGMDFSEGNYGSGAINLGSAMLPSFIERAGYTRNMYNTNPGSLADDIASLGNRSGNYIPLTLLPRAIAPSTIAGINYNRALLGTLGAETIYDTSSMFSEPEVTPTIDTDKTIQYQNTDPKEREKEPVSNPKQFTWKGLEPKKSKFLPKSIKFPEGEDIYAFEGKKGVLAKNGGWLENYNDSKASAPEGMVGDGFSNVGRNYSPAWGGQFEEGGEIPMAQNGTKKPIYVESKNDPRYRAYQDSLSLYNFHKNPLNLPGTLYKQNKAKVVNKAKFIELNNKEGKLPYYDMNMEKFKKNKTSTNLKDFYKPGGIDGISPAFVRNIDAKKKEIINDVNGNDSFDYSKSPYYKMYTDGKYKMDKEYTQTDPKSYTQYEVDPITGVQGYVFHNFDNPSKKDIIRQVTLSSSKIKPQGVFYLGADNPITYQEMRMKKVSGSGPKNDQYVSNKTYSVGIEPYYKKPTTPVFVNENKYNPNDPRLLDLQKRLENTLLKPQQQVIVKPTTTKQTTKPKSDKSKPDKKRDKLTPIQNNIQPEGIESNFNIETSLPVIRPEAKIPKSYNVHSQRYNMKGPSEYYDYNREGISLEELMKVQAAADAYNADVERRYGPQNEYRTPMSAKVAAERYKQLRQEVKVTPNYKEGGLIPMAQNGDRATRSDSLAVYNSTRAVEDYFKKQGYIKEIVKDTKRHKDSEKHAKSWVNDAQKNLNAAKKQPLIHGLVTQASKNKEIADAKRYLNDAQKNLSKTKDEVNPKKYLKKLEDSRVLFNEKGKDVGTYVDEQGNLIEGKPSAEKFYSPIDENRFYQREQSQGFLDLRSPMPLYDERITPQDLSVYMSPESIKQDELVERLMKTKNQKEKDEIEKQLKDLKYSDHVEMYDYDPLAVMPFDILKEHPELIPERIKKYGIEGIPTSVIQQHPEWGVKIPIKNTTQPQPIKDPVTDTTQTISLTDEQVANENGMYDESVTPREPNRYKFVSTEGGTTSTGYITNPKDLEYYKRLQKMYNEGDYRNWLGIKNKVEITPEYDLPGSWDVNSVRYNMQGPSDHYNYNLKGVDYRKAMDLKAAADAYNAEIQKKYGPQNKYPSPKAAEEAAKRLKQLRQEFNMTSSYQMGGNVYPVNYVPQAQEGTQTTYSYPLRDKLYSGEDEYFKAHPEVTGMAAEDNQVIINPYSKLTAQQKEGIRMNETARLAMRNGYPRPDFELTPEQQEFFSTIQDGKPYSEDLQDIRETIIGRILSGDDSAGNVTPEQKKYAEELQKVLKFRGGGSVPGSVGFTYARTKGIPSNGPYAKKTMASAKNGGWLDSYEKAQDGNTTGDKPKLGAGKYYTTTGDIVDWGTPEYERAYNRGEVLSEDGVRSEVTLEGGMLPEIVIPNNYKDGFWGQSRKKYMKDNEGAGLYQAIGSVFTYPMSVPQHALTYLTTGKVQDPSEAWGHNTNEGWFDSPGAFGRNLDDAVLNLATDPTNWLGVGELTALGRLNKAKAIEKLVTSKQSLSSVIKANPLISTIPKVLKHGLYKDFGNAAAYTIADKIGAATYKLPILDKKYKDLAYKIGSYDSSFNRNIEDLKTIFNKNYEGGDFTGYFGDNTKERDLLKQYIYGNQSGFEKSDIPIKGLDKYVNKYGEMENFKLKTDKLLSSDIENNAIPLDYLSGYDNYFGLTSRDRLNMSGKEYAERVKDWIKNNQNKAVGSGTNEIGRDNIAGHLKFFRYDPVTDKYIMNTQDIWKFSPEEYTKKWGNAKWKGLDSHGMTDGSKTTTKLILDDIILSKQASMMERAGKPFTLTDERSIDFGRYKEGGIIKDDRGQWDHPGEITEINSPYITMQGVPFDVLGISDTGDTKLMKPGKDYKFKGKKVTEFPMAKNGLRQEQKSLQNLDNLLNFTNYNKPQPGGWLSKYE